MNITTSREHPPCMWMGDELTRGEVELSGIHTTLWRDGLKVQRVAHIGQQIILHLTWHGKTHEVRLGARVAELRRVLP